MQTIPTIRMAEFEEGQYVAQRKPCVIVDGLASYEYLRRWTPAQLAVACGDTLVSVAVSFERYSGGQSPAAERKRPYRLANVALRDAVRWMTSAELADREFYVPQEAIEKFPPLCRDVMFGKRLQDSRVRVWIGTAHTVTPLHHDLAPNMFAQIFGEKRFLLYSPDQAASLYPKTGEEFHVSAVDPRQPDLHAYPRFSEATPAVVTVRAGEVLFLPSFWWHHVTSLSLSISVNQWWKSDLHEYCNRTGARLMVRDYKQDGWAALLKTRKILLDDLLTFAEQAAAADQVMSVLALSVLLDNYDRWPDHTHGTAPIESDVRQDVERLKQAVLDDEAYEISRDTVAALARRVRDESVLGAFARGYRPSCV
jgi:hypothetical protein